MYQTLRYEKQENIGILTINRPEALNALNSTVIGDLEQAIPAEAHELGVLEHPELVAHCRLAQLHRIGNVLHAELIVMQRI